MHRIRTAQPGDLPDVVEMMSALRHEQGDPDPSVSVQRLERDALAPPRRIGLWVAEDDEAVAGYLMFQYMYEPAAGCAGIHLADVYVKPAFRRRGIGRSLVDALARQARREGAAFIWWMAKPTNAAALAFYKRLGAVGAPTVSYSWPRVAWPEESDEVAPWQVDR